LVFCSFFVIPAKAGIQVWRGFLDFRLRGNDVSGVFSDRLLAATWTGGDDAAEC
jgi:hypothetical protein